MCTYQIAVKLHNNSEEMREVQLQMKQSGVKEFDVVINFFKQCVQQQQKLKIK